MAIDAVFPAASELVMVYGGALAAGAFAGQHVVVFGHRIDSHFWAYVAVALAGTLGYLVGAIVGWAIGIYGGPPPPDGRAGWVLPSRHYTVLAQRLLDPRQRLPV